MQPLAQASVGMYREERKSGVSGAMNRNKNEGKNIYNSIEKMLLLVE